MGNKRTARPPKPERLRNIIGNSLESDADPTSFSAMATISQLASLVSRLVGKRSVRKLLEISVELAGIPAQLNFLPECPLRLCWFRKGSWKEVSSVHRWCRALVPTCFFRCCGLLCLLLLTAFFRCCGQPRLLLLKAFFRCCGQPRLLLLSSFFRCCGLLCLLLLMAFF